LCVHSGVDHDALIVDNRCRSATIGANNFRIRYEKRIIWKSISIEPRNPEGFDPNLLPVLTTVSSLTPIESHQGHQSGRGQSQKQKAKVKNKPKKMIVASIISAKQSLGNYFFVDQMDSCLVSDPLNHQRVSTLPIAANDRHIDWRIETKGSNV
jgi:hypothetical protein